MSAPLHRIIAELRAEIAAARGTIASITGTRVVNRLGRLPEEIFALIMRALYVPGRSLTTWFDSELKHFYDYVMRHVDINAPGNLDWLERIGWGEYEREEATSIWNFQTNPGRAAGWNFWDGPARYAPPTGGYGIDLD